MQRCFSDLKNAQFNVRKYQKIEENEENEGKMVICIFNKANANSVLSLIAQNDHIYKLGILFDPNNDISACDFSSGEYRDIFVGKTNQLYKLAQLLNEAG